MKTIHCKDCNIFLGDIRDATLKKGITYLCSDCNIKRVAADMMRKNAKYDLPEGFDKLFGGFKK